MKLTVFGASGGVGREVVRQALDAGHEVTAVVRDPGRLGVPAHPLLLIATVADLTDADALLPVLAGRDAVISALGAGTNKKAKAAPVTGPAAGAILEAMGRTGVRRLVVVSAAPVGPDVPEDGVLTRTVLLPLLRRALRDLYADLAVMEAVIAASDTEWTVIRPPRLLNKPHTGRYRRVFGGNVPGGRSIPRADVADALLLAVAEPAYVRQTVGISA
ncbi:NAD(P)H-binding protein [Streptomyces sp. NPDC051211]|uniref:NAD(P)-dependent oxidoreductase n=1 Tax=Streptomyces sp. NPDC051211 TaxID=3154643 RepID=UPI0034508B31